jgi:hypothetical protein
MLSLFSDKILTLIFVQALQRIMLYMQCVGPNNNLLSPTASITMESDLSKSVSTLSSNFSNIHKSVDRLVEVHEKQIQMHEKQIQIQKEHNEFMEKKFNKLIECLMGGVTLQSAPNELCFDDPSVEFGINDEHHDGSVDV